MLVGRTDQAKESMPGSRLLPDTQLVFSPELAAAIGLEEAVLLQQIQGLYRHQPATRRGDLAWLHVSEAYLLQLTPFWDTQALQRICASLEAMGLLCIDRQNAARDGLLIAINDAPSCPVLPAAIPAPGPTSIAAATPSATPQPAQRAAAGTVAQTAQPPAEPAARDHPPAAAKPRSSASPSRTSGSARYPARGEGQPLPLDFQPSEDMLELLERFHGVPRDFALQQLEDFTLYWRERGSAGHAWQNRFKQHVQFHWARHQQEKSGVENAGQRGTGAARRTRDSSLEHDLTDTSWAD
jgi:hypothetical protein